MIRAAMQGEHLAIGRVYCETWKAAYRGLISDEFLNGLTEESCAPRRISKTGMLICVKNEEIIGVIGFGPERKAPDGKNGEIYSIYVLPAYWRSGVGRSLFDAARKELYAAGYESLILWTLTENRRARQFYEKMGLTACAQRFITIGGRNLSETGYIQTLN